MTEPDATLANWKRADWGGRLRGEIVGDRRGQFYDGTQLITSPVMSVDPPGDLAEGSVVTMKNAVYRLGRAATE